MDLLPADKVRSRETVNREGTVSLVEVILSPPSQGNPCTHLKRKTLRGGRASIKYSR